MFTQTLPAKPWRLELRRRGPIEVTQWALEYQHRVTADVALARVLQKYAENGALADFAPHGAYRLVLLGPDRTTRPESWEPLVTPAPITDPALRGESR